MTAPTNSTTADWTFEFDFLGVHYNARLTAGRYLHGGGAYIAVETWDEQEQEYQRWTDFSCNVAGAFTADPDYDIIVNHNCDGDLVRAVIDTGLIEPESYTQVRSGYVVMPVHAMTDKARAWFDAQPEVQDAQ